MNAIGQATRYNANDVHDAIRKLNAAAGRPEKCLPGNFGCDKSGDTMYKFYEVVTTSGAQRAIAYCQSAQLAVMAIDLYRRGFEAGKEQETKRWLAADDEQRRNQQEGLLLDAAVLRRTMPQTVLFTLERTHEETQ